MNSQKSRRRRGVILTPQGLHKLQSAKRHSELQNNSAERYTLEELSERTGLVPWTLIKVLNRVEAVDKHTLEYFFRAFNLELDKSDYSRPVPDVKEAEQKLINTLKDWGEAIDVSVFYGRTEELTKLKQWIIQERCRLVVMLGMGGIGKTALSVKLAEKISGEFEYVIWRSLRNAPLLKDLLTDIIRFLSDEQEMDLPENAGERASRLIGYLHEHRCLLVLDNVETILCNGGLAGYYREGYEGYGEFFRRVGEEPHQSAVVLTSREKPKGLALLAGIALPVRSLYLSGLTKVEGQEILKSRGLCGSQSEWRALVEYYAGNPLALKIVSTTIEELFDGNVVEFLEQSTRVFGDIRDLLEQQFNRLSNLEKEIMYWLAINREPVALTELREDIVLPISPSRLLEALQSLGRRSLSEKSASGFTLQPVVMEYVTEQLVEQVCEEIAESETRVFRSHALLKAQAKDYVRAPQVRLILKPVIDGLLTIFRSKSHTEAHLTQILSILREKSPREPGYAGGNILNLLYQMETDLSGYDFSYLTVWQAHLQCADLHHANFTHANLAKSVFAEVLSSTLSVAFSPNGKLLVTGDTDGKIHLWQLADCIQLLTCSGHTGWVWSVAFSPQGKILASGGADFVVRLWDIGTGQCLKTLQKHTDRVCSVAFSPDGHTLASGSVDQTVRLWNVQTGECFSTLQGHTDWVRAIAFSPQGNTVASSSNDSFVKLWDVSSGQCLRTLQGHTDWVWSVAFSPDGCLLASGSLDSSVRLWDIQTGECFSTLQGHNNKVRSVIFSPDGQTLVSGGDDSSMRLWDVQTGECFSTLQGHSNRVWSIAFSPDGTTLASGSDDQAVKLWEVTTGRCLRTLQGYSNRVWSVVFSPDSQTLAIGSDDRKVRLWNFSSGQCLMTLQGHTDWLRSIAFSPDGQTLVSSSDDSSVQLWNVRTGHCFKSLPVLEGRHNNWVWALALSPDGHTLATESNDHTIKLWDIGTSQCLQTLQGHTDSVLSVTFSSQGTTLASGSQDHTIKLWDIGTGQCMHSLQGHTDWVWSVTFSSQGNILASGSIDHTVRLWDTNTGQCLKTLQGHTSWVLSVAFSPDGYTLASGSIDQTVRLWDVRTGQCLNILQGHSNRVRSVAFSPDGHTLASGSDDQTVRCWDKRTSECLKTLSAPRPYEGMNITGVTGLTEVTIATLKALGAAELDHPSATSKTSLPAWD